MKSGIANTDLNSPDKLELEVARILAKRKKRLGSSHSPSPAELRKLGEDSKQSNVNNENSKKLVTEATQTEPPTVTQEKVPSRAHVYGDYKFYDDHKERGFYDQTPSNRDSFEDSQNHRTSSRYRNSYDDSRMPRTASEHRSSYGEKHQNYTPPTIRRVASAHTSPWALKRDMFLDDDVPDFTSTSQPHKPKPTPYQSTTSFSDRYTHQIPHNSTNSSSPYKPLSDQITEQITKNMYYSDHTPLANYPTTAPSSPFFPSFNPANKQPHPPNHPAPPPVQNQQWQPEQLQQQLQQHQQLQQQQQPAQQTQQQTQQPLQHTPSQQLQHTQSQHAQSQPLQHTQSQKSRYQQSQDNSECFDASTPAIAVTPPTQQPVNPSFSPSRPLSPLISSYAVGDTDSVYSESEYEDEEDPEQEEPYELTTEDHMNVVLTGTELLMVMEKGMNKYHVSVNMPSMSKLMWSERGKIIGSQELKDVTDVSCMPHAIHPQLDNLQWHTAVSGGPLSKWGDSAWATLGFTLTVKKSIKGASRRKKIDFVCSTHEMQQSWVIGLNAIIQSKSNGRRSAPMPFAMTNGAGSNEVDKVVAYIDKVMGIDESVVDKVAQLVEQKRRVLHSTSPPRATVNKRSSLTIMPVAPSYLTSPAPSFSAPPPPPPSFPAPPTPTHAIPAPLAPASAPLTPAQIEPRATPTFTRSNTPTLPLVSRPPITRSNTSTGVLRVSPPGVKPRAPVARASSPLRRSVHL